MGWTHPVHIGSCSTTAHLIKQTSTRIPSYVYTYSNWCTRTYGGAKKCHVHTCGTNSKLIVFHFTFFVHAQCMKSGCILTTIKLSSIHTNAVYLVNIL